MRRHSAPVKPTYGRPSRHGAHESRETIARPQSREEQQNIRFSVFRPVIEFALADIEREFHAVTSDLTRRVRNEADQRGKSVSLVAKKESTYFRYKRGITNQDILDAIYEQVLSIRRPMYITVKNVGVFGSNKDANKSIGLALSDESAEDIHTERQEIIGAIEDFIDPASDYDPAAWFPNNHPHISLGRVQFKSATDDRRTGIIIKKSLVDFVPTAPIKLERASFDS